MQYEYLFWSMAAVVAAAGLAARCAAGWDRSNGP